MSIHHLFDIYEICALIASYFTTSRDLYALTLVNRQWHQSFNPLLWQECHIFLTSNDAPRPFQGRRYVPHRQKQQPTDHGLARWGHFIRTFKLKIFKANVSTFILDLMRLHARQLVSVTIASAFMSTDDFKELVMGLAPMMVDFGALCRNDVEEDCGEDCSNIHLAADSISTFDHGLLSHTITSLKLELEPSVVREVLPVMIAARRQDDRVLAGLLHFQLECEDLHSQTMEEVIKTKRLPVSMVHDFLNVFPKLETLCTSFMLIMEDEDLPLDKNPIAQGEELFQGASPRLRSLTVTPSSPTVLSSLLARTVTPAVITATPRTICAISASTGSTESALWTASGLQKLSLTCFTDQPLLSTVTEYRLSDLESFSYTRQGQFAYNLFPAKKNQDQDWIALWKSLPQLKSLYTICINLSSQVSRSLVVYCPRLEKVTQISIWQQQTDAVRDPGWGGALEILRGANELKILQFSQYVDVKFFHRLIRHPTSLSTLLLEGSESHSDDHSAAAHGETGSENGAGGAEEVVQETDNVDTIEPLSLVPGFEVEDLGDSDDEGEDEDDYVDESEDEDDQDYVYVDDSDDTYSEDYDYEGEVARDEQDEEEQEQESIAQCISETGCLNSLQILRIHRLSLDGPTENHIFRQAIRLLSRLWCLQVSGIGMERWALLSQEDIGLRCGMDLPKGQFIYPCLREVTFSKISGDTKDDIESIVAIMPKLCIFRTIGLNLSCDDIFDIRNQKQVK